MRRNSTVNNRNFSDSFGNGAVVRRIIIFAKTSIFTFFTSPICKISRNHLDTQSVISILGTKSRDVSRLSWISIATCCSI